MDQPYEVTPGVHVLSALVPVPTIGLLPTNAFVVKAKEPYLVDTGLLGESDELMRAVETILDPADLRWIYLTHTDPDHIGALYLLLDKAPRAQIITTVIALAKLQLGLRPLPPHRVLVRNPGESLDLGDRTLSITRPALLDAPETTSLYDHWLDTLFSADMFGCPLTKPVALANDIPREHLAPNLLLWASVDCPWIHHVDRVRFTARLREVDSLNPAWILSAHLPPAARMAKALCHHLAEAPDAAPFVAPDQAALEAMQLTATSSPAL